MTKIIIDNNLNTIKISFGLSGGFEAMTLCGENVPTNYQVTSYHIEKK